MPWGSIKLPCCVIVSLRPPDFLYPVLSSLPSSALGRILSMNPGILPLRSGVSDVELEPTVCMVGLGSMLIVVICTGLFGQLCVEIILNIDVARGGIRLTLRTHSLLKLCSKNWKLQVGFVVGTLANSQDVSNYIGTSV